jgi:DNA topoisomerase I
MKCVGLANSEMDNGKRCAPPQGGRRASWWRRNGKTPRGFYYTDKHGVRLTGVEQLERIKSLVIPPAWTEVRVNPFAGGKIQAVGIDGLGRVQYMYHPTFVRKQQRKKFARIEEFGKYLPALKQVTNEHLGLAGLPREKVLAVVLRLINSLYFRVGTDTSERRYKTYGVTTLQKRHLSIGRGGKLEFDFVGKSHIRHRKVLVDPQLAAVIKQMAELKRGRKLFRYIDDEGKPRPITPSQINRYLKEVTDARFSAKDFRTWGGSLLAAVKLAELGPADSVAAVKKNIVRAVKYVAEELGNTPAVCRASYIHPRVLEAYAAGNTIAEFRPRSSRSITLIQELEPEEKALLELFTSLSTNGNNG